MRFNFEATGVGSVPFTDAAAACRIISENFKSIPFWPQLPKRSFLENMYVQYAEGLPGIVCDEPGKKIHIDTSRVAAEIENVYSRYLDGDLEFFRISEERARGLYAFEEAVGKNGEIKCVKGQVTGPVSCGLFLTDQNKKSIIYDKDLFEILTKTLVMKAKWQVRKLKKIHPSVIMFIDEPYLVSTGSSFVNVRAADAGERIDEVAAAIRSEGALAGLHCCGNTDWSELLKRGIDILNFDAYNFMKEFSVYHAEIKSFTARGGTIALGVIPTSEAIEKETRKSLFERTQGSLDMLSDKGVDKKSLSVIITPSCGVGAMDEAMAVKTIEMTAGVSAKLAKHG